jgi:hypothetical protein
MTAGLADLPLRSKRPPARALVSGNRNAYALISLSCPLVFRPTRIYHQVRTAVASSDEFDLNDGGI